MIGLLLRPAVCSISSASLTKSGATGSLCASCCGLHWPTGSLLSVSSQAWTAGLASHLSFTDAHSPQVALSAWPTKRCGFAGSWGAATTAGAPGGAPGGVTSPALATAAPSPTALQV